MEDKEMHNKTGDEKTRTSAIKPDEETLHTTDPQENMEGPVSSIANKINDGLNSGESKEEADRKKDEHM